ncbi:MAG: hypothetical protein ABII88_07180 [Candidatus Omnitrophota bacterium]
MSNSKKLGKGLEDISYLFLSPAEEDSLSKESFGRQEKKTASILETPIKSICLIGNNSSFLDAFLVINLSLALARLGMRIAVVDMEPELPCLNFFLGNELQKGTVDNSEGLVREGPLGVKLVSLNKFTFEHLAKNENSDRIIEQLSKIEEDVDLILVNVMQKNLFAAKSALNDLGTEFLVISAPDKNRILDSYRIIKTIFQSNPLSKVGLVVTDVNHMYEIDAVYNKMFGAVKKFLDKELYKCGFLFKIRQDVDFKATIASFYDADLTACISNIAQIVLLRLNLGGDVITKGSFFKKMVSGFSLPR